MISGNGAFSKSWTKSLVVSAATYTGDTAVNAGRLTFASANPNNEGCAVSIAAGATLNLTFAGTDTVDTLFIGGTEMPAGIYKAIGNPGPGTGIAQITGTGTLTVTTGSGTVYDNWAAGYGLTGADALPDADPDHDGMTNRQEYAFGLNPTSAASGNPITAPFDKTTGTFSYTRRDPALTGLTYTVITTTALGTWTPDADADQTVTGTSGEVQTVKVTLSGTLLNAPALFMRVKAE
jgi:autotransporter-associated beta strand protein